jgi:hypothetical protein
VITAPPPPNVHFVRTNNGVRVEFEAVGVARGACGLERRARRVALGTALFTAVVVPIAVLQLASDEPSFVKDGGVVVLGLVLAAMWTMVLALVLYTIELATRRTTIGVLDGVMLVERKSRIATRRTTIAPSDLIAIAVEPVYAPLHRRAITCLVVRRRGDDPLALLVERPRTELEWLARTLDTPLGGRAERR